MCYVPLGVAKNSFSKCYYSCLMTITNIFCDHKLYKTVLPSLGSKQNLYTKHIGCILRSSAPKHASYYRRIDWNKYVLESDTWCSNRGTTIKLADTKNIHLVCSSKQQHIIVNPYSPFYTHKTMHPTKWPHHLLIQLPRGIITH